jgi:choline monooxygenase
MTAPIATAPVARYLDPERYARERARIFAASWQLLGVEADLAEPGDYIADTIAGFPLMVVRNEQGALAGFHNVCRHRAGPLVTDAKGHCDHAFVCHYHAWTYDLQGTLTNATGFGPADGFSPSDFSLHPLQVATWRGLVFACADPAARPLAELIAPLERCRPWHHLVARARDRHPIACNWKVYVENYLDGYHLEGLHPGLAGESGAQRHDVRLQGDVALFEMPGRRSDEGTAWAWVWPNLGISLWRGVLTLERALPDGVGGTVVDHWFLHEPEDPRVDASIHAADRITDEDKAVCERVQENLAAGIYRQGVLSPTQEGAVAWFQDRVERACSA